MIHPAILAARLGPLAPDFDRFMRVTATAKASAVYGMRLAALLLPTYEILPGKKGNARSVSNALARADLGISQDIWGSCLGRDPFTNPNDPFQLVFFLERMASLPERIDQAIARCAAYAIYAGTRANRAEMSARSGAPLDLTADRAAFDFRLHVADHSAGEAPHSIVETREVATYLCATHFVDAATQLGLHENDVTMSHFSSETELFLSGGMDGVENVSQPSSLPGLSSKRWLSDGLYPLRLRLLGRAGWAEIANAEFRLAGLGVHAINEDLKEIGPAFNDVDDLGIPIAGSFDHFRRSASNQGLAAVDAVRRTGTGIVIEGRSGDLSLLSEEDLAVTMALAFLEAQPTDPEFSLESDGAILQRREFEPAWLGGTQFGHSMFYADYLLQQFVFIKGAPVQSMYDYRLSWEPRPTDSEPRRAAMNFLGGLYENEKLEVEGYVSTRLAIRLSDVGVKLEGNDRSIVYERGSCYIDSSTIVRRPDGSLDRAFRRNDPTTAIGMAAARFTKHLDKVSSLFPVFARVEQLLILYKMLSFARSMGWQISSVERDRCDAVVNRAKSLSARRRHSVYPYHFHGCQCVGNWPTTHLHG